MDYLARSNARSVAGFSLRHRWGFLTLAAALFVWGVGALGTPAPAVVGVLLVAVCGLLLLALGRFGARRRTAFALSERRRTHTSLALYGTSGLLAAFFLAGLFVAPRSAIVAGVPLAAAPAHVSATSSWIPALASAPAFAVDRLASKLPALYELGTRLPLVARAGTRRDAGVKMLDASRTMDQPGAAAQPVLANRDDTLRILSFNVWHGYPGPGAREERYERIRDLMRESDADVVLLQESWSTRQFGSLAERLSRELDLHYAYARANGSLRYLGFEEGLAILSRHPISDVRRLALGPRMPPWEMRAALGALVALPGGDSLEVWNTHLSHSDAYAREGQARSLASALAGSKVAILGGDFNAGASSAVITAFSDLEMAPVISEGIDHILASPKLREQWSPVRVEARRFGQVTDPGSLVTRPEVSDHPALLVELRRQGPAGTQLVDL